MTLITSDLTTGEARSEIGRAHVDAPDVGDTGRTRPTSALPSPPALPFSVEELTSPPVLPPAVIVAAAPVGEPPPRVRAWFDDAASADIPEHDGTIGTARVAAQAYARRAKAENTRRAYRAGVRA